MHTLSRQIRFSLDPFAEQQVQGFNSYASKPTGGDMGVYFSLWVDLASEPDPDTGFVINVSQIDHMVREQVISIFENMLHESFQAKQTPQISALVNALRQSWKKIKTSFRSKKLTQLSLELNPFRKITIQSEEAMMFIFSEKFEFSAMHQLWNDNFDNSKNIEVFGKCSNLAGHGHNYIIEVSVEKTKKSLDDHWQSEFQKEVKEHFLDFVDHKNLNVDVPEFELLIPTVENLCSFAWQKLVKNLKNAKLNRVIVWENDRTYCSYSE
jgi:6-pyruvoyltetrahydropterin/6-carboxytetrahydropterin synthase